MTLEELEREVRRRLERYPAPEDGRTQPFPDGRTLRWYQQIGVMDRPDRYEGRQAVYTERHALQATAAKRLQAQGESLQQIQRQLAGASDAQLRALLGERPGPAPETPTPPEVPPPGASPFLTWELASGLLLVVDQRLHPQPQTLFARLQAALANPGGT